MDTILSAILDTETLFINMRLMRDDATRKVYVHLYKILRDSILKREKPSISFPGGDPPFEKPSIKKAISNFVVYKYRHLSEKEFSVMTEVAQTFLHCVNHWSFQPPSEKKETNQELEMSSYRINYTRWLVFCHVPSFCSSLDHYLHETSEIFGKTLLKAVFGVSLFVIES